MKSNQSTLSVNCYSEKWLIDKLKIYADTHPHVSLKVEDLLEFDINRDEERLRTF